MPLIKAYAKVNLALDILYRRDDGYHELCSLMHSIDLCDDVVISEDEYISFESNIPLPRDNTAVKAAEAYSRIGGSKGAHIKIIKRIPSEAGLGGGSADAAAVIIGMQKIYHALDIEMLGELASTIGADVPFCLSGGAALAAGIGERLFPIPRLNLPLLMVKPRAGINTGKLFSNLKLPCAHHDVSGAVHAYLSKDLEGLGKRMGNSLEAEAFFVEPQLAEIKNRMLECGALGACMTGSGSAIVGLFEDGGHAQWAASKFGEYDFIHVCG